MLSFSASSEYLSPRSFKCASRSCWRAAVCRLDSVQSLLQEQFISSLMLASTLARRKGNRDERDTDKETAGAGSGMSQDRFAGRLGKSYGSVRGYEAGRQPPPEVMTRMLFPGNGPRI